jgi:hypothetical protein
MPIERKTKTVQDVLLSVKRQFGDESGVQITDSDIIRWVDDAQREIMMNNPEINAAVVSVNVTAGEPLYPVLTHVPDIESIHSVHYNGQILRNKTFLDAQETIIRSEDTSQGTPQFWYEYAGTINLWPIPQESKTGGLKIFYSKSPTEITTTGQVLSIPDSYFNAIVTFCMKQAMAMDENFQAAQSYDQQFEIHMQKLANRTSSQANQYPTITLLPGDSDY